LKVFIIIIVVVVIGVGVIIITTTMTVVVVVVVVVVMMVMMMMMMMVVRNSAHLLSFLMYFVYPFLNFAVLVGTIINNLLIPLSLSLSFSCITSC
jgi:hypothetical protein